MAFLKCSECSNMLKAVQISHKISHIGEKRMLEYTPTGIKCSDWTPVNENYTGFVEGIYCPNCSAIVPLEKEEIPLCEDSRIPGVVSQEFSSDEVLERLRKLADEETAEIYVHTLPAKAPIFADIPLSTPDPIKEALLRMGIKQLYIHQAQAADAVRSGSNVVLVTSTSSGKTLSYNLPIISYLYNHPTERALYIFPTKALANDQLDQIKRFGKGTSSDHSSLDEWFETHLDLGDRTIHIGRLDGDTENGPRQRIMENAQIWMTNPDMIHYSILGQVQKLKYASGQHIRNYLRNLKFIVLDEMHMYRGTFGSHVALVLRRLLKVCRELGNIHRIQIITSSATIENPERLAEDLTGLEGFVLINTDGSAHQKKDIVLWNPGMSTGEQVRRAPSTDAITMAKQIMTVDQKVIKSIIFQPSRSQTMVFTRYIKDVLRQPLRLSKDKVEGEKLVAFYTGILPNETRKRIIDRLKSHEIHVIITTNALEVGIDIGDLSLAVLVGYPGSKAAFSQQIGRVGRKGEGVAILIWQDDPLQQYYMRNPLEFIHKAPEVVRINPTNYKLLSLHLPLLKEEIGREITAADLQNMFPSIHEDYIRSILQVASASAADEQAVPDKKFSLRSISGQNYSVTIRGQDQIVVDGLDEWSAFRDFHEGAIYWTPGDRAYRVDSINRRKGEIILLPIQELTYHTQSTYRDAIDILHMYRKQDMDGINIAYGELEIKRSVFGYKKVYFGQKHDSEQVQLEHPYVAKFAPEGMWLTLSDSQWAHLKNNVQEWADENRPVDALAEASLFAAGHAMTSVIPDMIICDTNDFTGFFASGMAAFASRPVIGFYGENGSGLGTIEAIYEKIPKVMRKALELIQSCPCAEGCPSCVQLPGKGNIDLFKPGAKILLKTLIEGID
ncbi:DEAD/DEAH box helicase [Paenibacillus mesophilus]|uniref:DEAD/DEAH box helicase n=1 Tax=Paenibacillus mesophilus TaxID=2582849 RepID=UPI00110F2837|nr:DEAD/DEAH box helicase [Paenibacillus mesophilus]TMV47041.1 DEAD/DEAH box helicase [Paenibacillus mesophilus]